jgi:hypothetical protein
MFGKLHDRSGAIVVVTSSFVIIESTGGFFQQCEFIVVITYADLRRWNRGYVVRRRMRQRNRKRQHAIRVPRVVLAAALRRRHSRFE